MLAPAVTARRFLIVWSTVRSSLWFVPAVIVIALVALAIGLVEIDGVLFDAQTLSRFPRLFGAGADGARGMLGAIASAMITVAGVTFSITIVALSLTASQYSSRVLRNFMRDRSNQTVLGIFVGIYAYCLIVLRTIRGGESDFVPSVATFVAVLLAFVGIALLIHFIHHISRAIQAVNILASIAEETEGAIGRLYPEPLGEEATLPADALSAVLERGDWRSVVATESGYVQSVDMDALIGIVCEFDTVVRLDWRIGEFVAAGQALARVPSHAPEAVDRKLAHMIVQGRERTMDEDAAFGFRQIVDIAQRALSPGINDPTTAVSCVDRLTALLLQLSRRHFPSPYRRAGGALRVIAPAHGFADFVALAFDEIRTQARTQPPVLVRLADALRLLREEVAASPREAAMNEQLAALRKTALAIEDSRARAQVVRALEKAQGA